MDVSENLISRRSNQNVMLFDELSICTLLNSKENKRKSMLIDNLSKEKVLDASTNKTIDKELHVSNPFDVLSDLSNVSSTSSNPQNAMSSSVSMNSLSSMQTASCDFSFSFQIPADSSFSCKLNSNASSNTSPYSHLSPPKHIVLPPPSNNSSSSSTIIFNSSSQPVNQDKSPFT